MKGISKFMNEVFLIGKVISKIEFDFIIESKSISCATFYIKTLNNQIIKIKAFDGLADFVYSKLSTNKIIFIYGRLEDNYVTARNIETIILQ